MKIYELYDKNLTAKEIDNLVKQDSLGLVKNSCNITSCEKCCFCKISHITKKTCSEVRNKWLFSNVEDYLIIAGLIKGETYFKEMKLSAIERKWDIDLSGISNQGKAEKRFDFVVKKGKTIYAIETNFYTGGGSKLNETARSYKTIALEAKEIDGFAFVWFTDGADGWKSARHNLEETFDVLDNMYCIADLENGIIERLFD